MLLSLLSSIALKNYSHRCIVGDFNFRDINWDTCTTPHGENSKEHKFIETIRDCFFFQQVREPTRKRGDDRPSQLDLVFTDEDMQVSDIKYLSPLGKSDHSMIVFDFHCYIDYTNPKTSYKYSIADYEEIRKDD